MNRTASVRAVPATLATLFALTLIAALPGDSERAQEEEAIRATIQLYFDGIMNFDVESLERAFHADAYLYASLPGRFYRSPFQEWKRFAAGEPPDPEGRVNRIVSIDVAGSAAVVKTDLEWPDVHYVDYLSLLKIDGEWKIVNKIWHQERK